MKQASCCMGRRWQQHLAVSSHRHLGTTCSVTEAFLLACRSEDRYTALLLVKFVVSFKSLQFALHGMVRV